LGTIVAIDLSYSTVFWSMLLLSFGLLVLVAGLFTAYFGAGRSRKIGLALSMIGILSLFLFAAFTFHFPATITDVVSWDTQLVLASLLGVVAAVTGTVLAIGLFLTSIMRA